MSRWSFLSVVVVVLWVTPVSAQSATQVDVYARGLVNPKGMVFAPDGVLYVAESGNHRIQKFTAEGAPLGTWGGPGKAPGMLHNPWALAVDSKGRVHVVDTENHRVQRIRF